MNNSGYVDTLERLLELGIKDFADLTLNGWRTDDGALHGFQGCSFSAAPFVLDEVRAEGLPKDKLCSCFNNALLGAPKVSTRLVEGRVLLSALEDELEDYPSIYEYELKCMSSVADSLASMTYSNDAWRELQARALENLETKMGILKERLASPDYTQDLIDICSAAGRGGDLTYRLALINTKGGSFTTQALISHFGKWKKDTLKILAAPTLVLNYLGISETLPTSKDGLSWSDQEIETAGVLLTDGGVFTDLEKALQGARALI